MSDEAAEAARAETIGDPAGAALYAFSESGAPAESAARRMIWGHGWGQDRRAFAGIAPSFGDSAHLLLDFPGFGAAPRPETAWDTGAYADAAAALIAARRWAGQEVVWIGHSFGGRVGLQLAARHPGAIDRLVLIAAAGLPRRRGALEKLRISAKRAQYKALRWIAERTGGDVEALRDRFGSADYRAAGPMREILVKVVTEDLTEVAGRVRAPTLLIYGAQDAETPPEIGARLAALIPGARLHVLDGHDHYSPLGAGKHVVAKRIAEFLKDR